MIRLAIKDQLLIIVSAGTRLLGLNGVQTISSMAFSYPLVFLRLVITSCSALLISWYILTIDDKGEETVLDNLKDFTALFLLIELDNNAMSMVRGEIPIEELKPELTAKKCVQMIIA